MAVPKFWVPYLRWDAFVADAPAEIGGDPDTDPEEKGIHGGVEITAKLSKGDIRAIRGFTSPRTRLYSLAKQDARLDDGLLKLTAAQEEFGLLAKCSILDLPDDVDIIYTFRPHHVKYNGTDQDLPTITVKAPVVPDDWDVAVSGPFTLNLADMEWLNESTAAKGGFVIRQVPDDVTLVGPNLVQFWANGSPLGEPISLVMSGSGPSNTDGLPEGTGNLYFTPGRVDARITAAQLVAKALTSTSGFQFVDNDPTLAGNSATKLVTQQAIRAFVAAKIAELIGAAPASLDTWTELVAAIQSDQGAISGIMTTLGTKATLADITTATAALVGGATSAGNTLKKLEDLITALSASVGGAPPMKFNTATTSWPARPSVSFPVFWVGGDAPVDRPPGMLGSDVWFPATGDDIDLGAVLEALQGITAAANTVPYFDAINHAASLAFKIAMSTPALDTNILSEKATKDAIDAAIAAQSATLNNDLGTSTAVTMAAAHAGKVNAMRPATAATLTVPLNSVTPLPLGVPFEYLADGAGQITVTKGNASITFKSAGNATKSRLQNSSFILWQQAIDVWLITGDITT